MHWVGIHWKWHPGRMIPLTDFSCPVRLHRDPVNLVWLFIYNLCVISLKRRQLALTGGFPGSSLTGYALWNPQWSASPVLHYRSIRPSFSTVHPASPLLCTWEDAKVAETQHSFRKHIMSILQRVVTKSSILKIIWKGCGSQLPKNVFI